MSYQIETGLDSVGWKILALLQEDARRSYRQIGQAIGLSAPAVAERVRRLEDAGVISGYHAAVDPQRAGYALLAQIRIGGVGDRGTAFNDLVQRTPEVLECHRVTGGDSFVLKVAVRSIAQLEPLIDTFVPFGEVTTALILSTPLARRSLEAPKQNVL